MNQKIELCNETSCLGCYACFNICPKNAVNMKYGILGFVHPKIDTDACIQCRLCQKACPVITPPIFVYPKQLYAGWAIQNQILKNAASAGVVTTIGAQVIREGGIVFGTKYCDGNLQFSHTDRVDELQDFQGSKYVQVPINNTYIQINTYLKQGRLVLFCATPCQIAGLKNYLGKSYENLITIDLVCHGVSSEAFLDSYLTEQNIKKYSKIYFKGKYGSCLVVENGDQICYKKDKELDLFLKTYAKGYISKEACYSCPFARFERVGDLTAGDFWGIKRETLIAQSNHVRYISLLLANSEKGVQILSKCKSLYMEPQPIDSALKHNRQLTEPCVSPHDRASFLENYPVIGFSKAMKKTEFYSTFLKNKNKTFILLTCSKIKHFFLK